MNSRLLITLLCAGAVALACGSLSRNDATLAQSAGTRRHEKLEKPVATRSTASPSQPHAKTTASIDGNFAVNIEPHALRFALNVTNQSKKNVELAFPNGQVYDFAVLDSVGKEVYRWGQGRMFTQSVQNKRIDGGDIMRFDERVETTLPRGKYLAVATLRSSNYPMKQSSEFVLK
ncbi:MAG: Intracellular proteinase inhibitor [Gemmatimonadetes bacterium]|nr:Intracellular proteinase inhibitor [Gemmatimonadota bacterium]